MDESFKEAFLHKQAHRVAGKRLRPFSLAAWFVLEVLDSPMLYRGEVAVTLADVQLAAKVCAAQNPRGVDLTPSIGERLLSWRWRGDLSYLNQEAQAFVHYVNDYASLPKFWRDVTDEGEGRMLSAPWILAKVCSLARTTALTPEQVWAMPAGEAFWYDAGIRELDGSGERFLCEGDDEEDVPDLRNLSEAELLAIATKDLGEEAARAFFEKRVAFQIEGES